MSVALFSLFVIFAYLIAGNSTTIIYIDNNSTTLQEYLCPLNTWQPLFLPPGTILSLSSNVTHIIKYNSNCHLSSLVNITIQSSSIQQKATISCSSNHNSNTDMNTPTTSFVFSNCTNLSLVNLHFVKCGGYLLLKIRQSIFNQTFTFPLPIFIPDYQTAVMLITHSSQTKIKHVTIDGRYHGYAIMAINLAGTTLFTDLIIQDSSNCTLPHCQGSGLLLLQSKPHQTTAEQIIIKIYNSKIRHNTNNYHTITNNNPIDDLYAGYTFVPIFGAGGLTLWATDYSSIRLEIKQVSVEKNAGNVVGGILIFIVPTRGGSQVSINVKYSSLVGNELTVPRRGAGISVFIKHHTNHMFDPIPSRFFLTFSHHTFISLNTGASHGSGAYIQLPNTHTLEGSILFDNSMLLLNTALIDGHALYVTTDGLNIAKNVDSVIKLIINNTYITRNGLGNFPFRIVEGHLQWQERWSLLHKPTLTFVKVRNVTFIGGPQANILQTAGPALCAKQTNIILTGSINFHNNYGRIQHIILDDLSYLIFKSPAEITFEEKRHYFLSSLIQALGRPHNRHLGYTKCPLQFIETSKPHYNNNVSLPIQNKITINFIGSTAPFTYFYSDALQKCQSTTFNKYFSPEVRERFVSPPEKFCLCGFENLTGNFCMSSESTHFVTKSTNLEKYPGQVLSLFLSSLDNKNESSPTLLEISVVESGNYTKIKQQYSIFLNHLCTQINTPLYLFSRNIFQNISRVHYMLSSTMLTFSVKIDFLPCPNGFQLNYIKGLGMCTCHEFLIQKGISVHCNISNTAITIPKHTWLTGNLLNVTPPNINIPIQYNTSIEKPILAYSSICPFGFCNRGVTQVNVLIPDYLCCEHRTGVLCGACIEGYSTVMGSLDCQKCSNVSLSYLLLYAVTGFTTVLLLLFFRITISDNLSEGFIFYAAINQISIKDDIYVVTDHVLRSFFSALTMNIGHSHCLYDGMTSLTKTGINYALPLYMWSLVILLIIASKYSYRLSNLTSDSSIQVLVTLFYFSFSMILHNLTVTFTYATIETEYGSYTVWYNDGNILYGRNKWHALLMCIGLTMGLVYVMPFLLWTTFSSLGLKFRWIRKRRNLVDAFHGQYRPKWGWFFGARLWCLAFSQIAYDYYRSRNTTYLLLCMIAFLSPLTLIQIYFKPYRNKWVNLFQSFLLINLLLSELIVLYFVMKHDAISSRPYLSVLQYTVMILVIFSISKNILMRLTITKLGRKIKEYVLNKQTLSSERLKRLARFSFLKRRREIVLRENARRSEVYVENDGSQNSEDDFREPLLKFVV